MYFVRLREFILCDSKSTDTPNFLLGFVLCFYFYLIKELYILTNFILDDYINTNLIFHNLVRSFTGHHKFNKVLSINNNIVY